jgi:hypothetical protein
MLLKCILEGKKVWNCRTDLQNTFLDEVTLELPRVNEQLSSEKELRSEKITAAMSIYFLQKIKILWLLLLSA